LQQEPSYQMSLLLLLPAASDWPPSSSPTVELSVELS
jgi:hypothetical protein